LPLAALSTVAIPQPANLADFVQDKGAAIALGKALFWDTQVGSDGIQSCATCHFHAGADSRTTNQLSPRLLRQHTRFERP
jgi:cytochrome c peroxidase